MICGSQLHSASYKENSFLFESFNVQLHLPYYFNRSPQLVHLSYNAFYHIQLLMFLVCIGLFVSYIIIVLHKNIFFYAFTMLSF